jgi:hypothetical protein
VALHASDVPTPECGPLDSRFTKIRRIAPVDTITNIGTRKLFRLSFQPANVACSC